MRPRFNRLAFAATLACSATLALFVSASAQDVTRAHLLTVPDATTLSDHFPPVALATGLSGRVVLSCAIALDGSSECSAAEETPANAGFGAAAAALAQDWRFSPRVEGGRPVTSVSRVPIEFQNANTAPLPIELDVAVDGIPTHPAEAGAERGFDPTLESSDDSRIVITASRFTRRPPREAPTSPPPSPPTRQDYNARFYPTAALQGGVRGRALVACAVRSDASIACALEQEAPAGQGFGERAVALIVEMAERRNPALTPGMVFRVPVDFATHAEGQPPAARANWGINPPAGRYAVLPYPQHAVERSIEGEVALICTTRADRKVDCAIAEETPSGWGFGRSALALAANIVVREDTFGQIGNTVGDRFRVHFSYRGQ